MKTDAKKRAAKRMAAEVFEAAKVPTPAKRKAKPLVGMPIHFCPTDQQRHFGPAERPLCSNYGPRYIGEVLAWGGANNPETVTCKECLRLYNVRNKMCRRCGTMITEVSVEKYQALCPKCKPQGLPKVGIVDVGADNKIERTWGKAQGREHGRGDKPATPGRRRGFGARIAETQEAYPDGRGQAGLAGDESDVTGAQQRGHEMFG